MNFRVNANAIITNEKGEVLMVKLKSGPYKGCFCIPGGGINPGETCFEAIRREIFEETEIVLEDDIVPLGFCELLKESIDQHRIVILLKANGKGQPKETLEATSLWMDPLEAEESSISFSKESLKLWRENKIHFIIKE